MTFNPRGTVIAAVLLGVALRVGAAEEKRRLEFGDLASIRGVSDAEVSPEGDFVAYVVRTADLEEDRIVGDIWMTSWDGARKLQLTHTSEDESKPRFSPDGRYLAFLAARSKDSAAQERTKAQVWLLERAGGEARKLTDYPGGVSDYTWSPDGKRLAIIASDPNPEDDAGGDAGKKKTPKPIVIDRYQFKRDGTGYLRRLRSHLYLFDVESRASDLLTPGDYDEALPSFSPDGTLIAFSSKREGDPDRNDNWDVYLIEARKGASPRRFTSFDGTDNSPSWGSPAAFSPDGRQLAYLRGSAPKFSSYETPKLVVGPVAGGEPRVLLPELDRAVRGQQWSSDGKWIHFLLEDDRDQVVARVASSGGPIERLGETRAVARDFSLGGSGRIAAVSTRPLEPEEVVAVEGPKYRALSAQNSGLLAKIELGTVEGIEFESRDGTVVHGMLVKPPGFRLGIRYPAIVFIHGGPVGQDGFEFDFTWQILAARGYVVIAPNYRGSSGRGKEFTRVIHGDWGNLEVQDVIAAVDHVVAQGIADPERLGIGGWSYGGITTNYAIASDSRFKAAVSGASVSNLLAAYGTDQYIRQYENEVGLPWKDVTPYVKMSYPFLHADRIRTPTLFLCGERDFNVPLINSEQMYQALKSLGVDTELVIYPGQYHGLSKPSYQRDRLERYVAWFDRYLKRGATSGNP
jgi:dipeptidyl aminopeptidase/acylaminoacyl peptidase